METGPVLVRWSCRGESAGDRSLVVFVCESQVTGFSPHNRGQPDPAARVNERWCFLVVGDGNTAGAAAVSSPSLTHYIRDQVV